MNTGAFVVPMGWCAMGWCAMVLSVGVRIRPRPLGRKLPPGVSTIRPSFPALLHIGILVHRTAQRMANVLGRPELQSWDETRLRRTGLLAVATMVGLAVSPQVCLLALLCVTMRIRVKRRRDAAAHSAAIARELPDTVELLAIAMSSGANLTQAIDITIATMQGDVADAFHQARAAAGVGLRIVDSLRLLPTILGEPAQPLVTALVLAEKHGTPLVQALRQLAVEMRDQRRRSAEEAARRVPIRLLAPLVLLLLPAFALLTVAPLIAGGLRSLRL